MNQSANTLVQKDCPAPLEVNNKMKRNSRIDALKGMAVIAAVLYRFGGLSWR